MYGVVVTHGSTLQPRNVVNQGITFKCINGDKTQLAVAWMSTTPRHSVATPQERCGTCSSICVEERYITPFNRFVVMVSSDFFLPT